MPQHRDHRAFRLAGHLALLVALALSASCSDESARASDDQGPPSTDLCQGAGCATDATAGDGGSAPDGGKGLDGGVDSGPVCGDQTCDPQESCASCPADCGNCSCPGTAEHTTSNGWVNLPQSPAASGKLILELQLRASVDKIDALAGVSLGAATDFGALQAIVRFNDQGTLDVRDGADYVASASLPYVAGTWYTVRLAIDAQARTYDVSAGPCGGGLTPLQTGAAFRTDAPPTASLDNLALWSSGAGSLEVAGVQWAPQACAPKTCAQLGVSCGKVGDGCGKTLDCGPCVCGDGACNGSETCSSCPKDCGSCPTGTLKSKLTQYGITWTFDKAYPCGQFVTGDWWVVGPVTVQSVTPAPTGTRNGSMVDPVGAQAYDSRGGAYDGSKGVQFPLQLSPDTSLVSAISHPEASACTQGSSPGWKTYDGGCQRGPIATQAVLTVLGQAPPADAFRPPYAGTQKPLHRLADVCWQRLPKLPAPASTPASAGVLRHVERPWIDHLNSWTMQHGCATLNMYCYGREIGSIVSTVSMYALLDTPQQQQVATRLLQLGIDNYGVLQAGGGWGGDGGHFNGRKWPIVFAGALLGQSAMQSPGLDVGNEDRMTYQGSSGKALWGRACSSCYFPNGCTYSGSCTGGAKDCRDPAGQVDGCSSYRNCCTSHTWVGEALAARILGLTGAWGHAPFFDYVDRWMASDVSGGGSAQSSFIDAMWTTYRNNLPAVGSCP